MCVYAVGSRHTNWYIGEKRTKDKFFAYCAKTGDRVYEVIAW